ncbi:hypothetical protein FB45DRAFT_48558 [Roridomyces roridus]|uniref:CFEM domain-containing protein n=1 Tax=Roridomyces roridus TaxID=1738132 RepID=A0AAD7F7E6_9AGAR|nr:hypothetical protein FB45DRAFT_966506 [Roridomyces roridus]KAJ7629102.1 hypothetical protein FB45DRAFT_48558 [Roridomyces roridus]
MPSDRTTASSPCVQKCAGASNDFEVTNCNPSDGACLCLSERFVVAVVDCVSSACPNDLPNAQMFLGAQCAIATHSLLDPRQDAGASTVPEDPSTASMVFSNPIPTPPDITSSLSISSPTSGPSSASRTSISIPSAFSSAKPGETSAAPHSTATAAIAGGVVGGLVALALIALTLWCMRGRFRLRVERVPPATSPSPVPAGTPPVAERMEQTHQGSTLTLDRPIPQAVVASQVAMWEKSGLGSTSSLPLSSATGLSRVPDKEPHIDVGSLMWNNTQHRPSTSFSASASGSGTGAGTSVPTSTSADGGSSGSRPSRPDPATEMQLRVMAERVAQLEAAISTRADLPPNYTQ